MPKTVMELAREIVDSVLSFKVLLYVARSDETGGETEAARRQAVDLITARLREHDESTRAEMVERFQAALLVENHVPAFVIGHLIKRFDGLNPTTAERDTLTAENQRLTKEVKEGVRLLREHAFDDAGSEEGSHWQCRDCFEWHGDLDTMPHKARCVLAAYLSRNGGK